MMLRRGLTLVLLLLGMHHVYAQDNLIEVTRGIESVPFLFISNFDGGILEAAAIQEVFQSDISSTGDVNLVGVPGAQMTINSTPDYERFRRASLDFAIAATVSVLPSGGLELRFELHGVSASAVLLEQSLSVGNRSNVRGLAHKFANEVYRYLTNRRGAFDTYIGYIREQQLSTGERRYQVVVADADGFGGTPVYSSRYPIEGLTWSPDNSRIAYTSWDKGYPTVYVQDLRSGQRTPMPRRPGLNSDPSFSPDGRSLAMVMSRGFNPDIYIVNLSTLRVRRVAGLNTVESRPDFSPDGNKLVFTSDRTGSPQIYEIDTDGRNERRVTFQGNYNADALYLPSGLQIAAVLQEGRRYRVGLVDLGSFRTQYLSPPLGEIDGLTLSPNGSVMLYGHKNENGEAVISGVSSNGQATFSLGNAGANIYGPAWSSFVSE